MAVLDVDLDEVVGIEPVVIGEMMRIESVLKEDDSPILTVDEFDGGPHSAPDSLVDRLEQPAEGHVIDVWRPQDEPPVETVVRMSRGGHGRVEKTVIEHMAQIIFASGVEAHALERPPARAVAMDSHAYTLVNHKALMVEVLEMGGSFRGPPSAVEVTVVADAPPG